MKRSILIPLMIGLLLTAGSVWLATAAVESPDLPDADPTFAGHATELVSQQWGAFAAVQVSGTYAYVPQGQRLSVFNIANPAKIKMIGQSEVMTGPSDALEISGGYAFLADSGVTEYNLGSRLHVLDISNPAAPFEAVYLENLNSKAYDIELYNGYAFLANNTKGLWVVDIRDPLDPQHVTDLSISEGKVTKVQVAHHTPSNKTYAYLVADRYLTVVDITDPAAPVKRASLQNDPQRGDFLYLAIDGDRAYLTDDACMLHVVDISDPLHPLQVAATVPGEYLFEGTLTASNNRLYLVDSWDLSLRIFDISAGGLPISLGQYPVNLRLFDIITLTDPTKVFLVSESDLQVINAGSPASPVLAGSFHQQGAIGSILRSGNLLYLGRGMYDHSIEAYDFSNLQNPILLGSLPIRGAIHDLSGDSLYILQSRNYSVDPPEPGGLAVIDVHDLAHMSVTDIITSTGSPKDVTVRGNLAYLADGADGLRIIDISDPNNLQELNRFDHSESIFAVSVATPSNEPGKTYAYLATSGDQLRVLDVTDPLSILERGSYYLQYWGDIWFTGIYSPSFTTGSLPAAGFYVVAAGGEAVKLFDVTNPDAPVLVETDWIQDPAEGLVINGDYLYIPAGLKGVEITRYDGVDTKTYGRYFLPEEVWEVAVSGDFLQLSTGTNGLYNIWFGPSSYLYMPHEPVASGVLTSTFHNTTLTFPAGSFTETVDLNYFPRYRGNMPSQSGLLGVGVYIDLRPRGSNVFRTPAVPYQFEWRYDDGDLGGLDESTLGLYAWDGSSWLKEPTSQVDTINNILTSESQKIRYLAVLTEARTLYLPLTIR